MNQNKLTIDLRRVALTDKQVQDLHNAIHKTVATHLEKAAKARPPKKTAKAKKPPINLEGTNVTAAAGTKTANIKVTFTNTNPGKSDLTAIHNGVSQNLKQTGSVSFAGVSSNDIIIIQGKSLGMTTVTIDIGADPMQMNFGPGHFNDNFFIN
jgi:hypothetical protein